VVSQNRGGCQGKGHPDHAFDPIAEASVTFLARRVNACAEPYSAARPLANRAGLRAGAGFGKPSQEMGRLCTAGRCWVVSLLIVGCGASA